MTSSDSRSPGLLTLCAVLFRGAQRASTGYTRTAIYLRLKIVAAWLRNIDILKRVAVSDERSGLGRAIHERPQTLGIAVWPYVHADWALPEKANALIEHYRQLGKLAPTLDVPAQGSLVVAALDDVRPGLSLIIDRSSWFSREGELVLNIFLKEQRIFSLAFSFGIDEKGPVARIGCIQGIRDDGILDVYRDLTKELHGLRPRDFIIDALRAVCLAVGVPRILAISDSKRQHRNAYFGSAKSEKLEGDYDQIWLEQGGVAQSSGFFEFASDIEFRPMEDIASKKRSMYRKRYDFLSHLKLLAAASCHGHPAPSARTDILQSS